MNDMAHGSARSDKEANPLSSMNTKPKPAAIDVTAIIIAMTDAEEPYALEAIRSTLNQTVRPDVIRIYVQHGNAWIDSMVSSLASIEVRRIDLAPPGAVRNIGAVQATTTWLAYLDGDDVWEPRKQEEQIAAVCEGASFIGCDYYLTDASRNVRVAALCRHIAAPSTWLVKRELMLACPFDPAWRHEDSSWWEHNRAWTFAARVPQALAAYRVRQSSFSNGAPGKRRKIQVLTWASKLGIGKIAKVVAWLAHAAYRSKTYPALPAFR